MNNTLALTCLLLAFGTTGLAPAQAADGAPAPSPGTRAALDMQHGTWWNGVPEDDHSFNCPENEVLVGRAHNSDENGDTFYRCATVSQNGAQIKFSGIEEYGPYKESKKDGHRFSCPKDTVLVGRSHAGDENGSTYYRCAKPLSSHWNDDPMQVTSQGWSAETPEPDSSYICEIPLVLIGRYHKGDENGASSYECGMMW